MDEKDENTYQVPVTAKTGTEKRYPFTRDSANRCRDVFNMIS